MLPISNVAIPNVQFQSTYAKASPFANASTSAKATVDKSVDETADKLELATLVIGNISTSVTFSELSSPAPNIHADDGPMDLMSFLRRLKCQLHFAEMYREQCN